MRSVVVDYGPLLADGLATGRPELQAELAPSAHPLALLPVRLETLFEPAAGGAMRLLVRIYPDKIHLDAHDTALTAEEVAAGQRYWTQLWRSGPDEARRRRAWQLLTDRFEAGRAAYVARRLRPANPADRPGQSLPEDAELNPPPQFPDAGIPATITRTPAARLLPQRWTATAYRLGQVVGVATGRDVAAELAIGPDLDPALQPAELADDAPSIDEGMRWMVDFDAAEAVGMGLRLDLPGPIEEAAIDVLIVAGVSSLAPDRAAARYADLLDAHRFTDGLAFVEPGTPTNNGGEDRAGYASRDLQGATSYAAEWKSPRISAGTAAGRTAHALGIDDASANATLGRLPGATSPSESVAAAMTTALWPATWGYFLSQMMEVSPEAGDWARAHARDHLRPEGALPVLRVGRQPYGLLPVTTLARWTATGDDAERVHQLRDLLIAARDQIWRPAVRDVARVGRTDDPSGDLIDVLRLGPTATGWLARRLIGPHYLRELRRFLGRDLDRVGFWPALLRLTTPTADRLGLGSRRPASLIVHEPAAHRLVVPLVTDQGSEWPAPYLADLLAADPDALAQPVPDRPMPLLQALLRHGLLREYANAAARLLGTDSATVSELLRDVELTDLVPGTVPTATWGWQRDQPVPGTDPPQTVRQRLADLDGAPAAAVAGLREFRAALGMLGTADPDTLVRHLTTTLDAASHRLDAWITSLATRRLADLRAVQPSGLRIGGYGWLENLRAEPRQPVTDLPPDEPGPLYELADDPGFIHAPSLGQAGTAALLRNAHLAHGGTADGPYAVQLTSERIRMARRLFDGVRQGQPLGALLGYDLERRMHDAGLSELIDDLRRIAPRPGDNGTATVGSRQVVDGLVLHALARSEVISDLGLGSDPRRDQVLGVLAALDSAIDAAADAITAESVHQFTRGNPSRGKGSLDDIASGNAPPPKLEVMDTPRSGTAVTHRVLLLLDADNRLPAESGWAGSGQSIRAAAEPVLNTWAGRLLGPATGVTCAAVDVVTGETHTAALTKLGLAPLDLVWLSGNAGGADELARRIGQHSDSGANSEQLRLDLSPVADRAARGMSDLLEVAAAARVLIAAARGLDGADLQPPHTAPQAGLDLDEYAARAEAAVAALSERRDGLAALLEDGRNPTTGNLRNALAKAADLGVLGATKRIGGADADPASPALVAVAANVLKELDRRRGEATADRPDDSEPARRANLQARFAAVFGSGFVAVPRFESATADLRASTADAALTAGDPLAPYTWLHRMQRVRPGLGRFGRALLQAEALGTGERLELTVGQVPHRAGQRWVALEQPAGGPPDGVASIVLHGDADLNSRMAGLLIEEWMELVPSRTETTGIAFRYDPPDAMAPQAILLAVPSVPDESWTVGRLNQVLLDTIDLAHVRAVDPELLDDVRQYLPAAALAFNADGDTVSTDLNPLAPAPA